MGKIDTKKVIWVLDLLTNDEASSDEELATWLHNEGQIPLNFCKQLVKHRTCGDIRKSKKLETFVYNNIDKLEG